MQVQIDSSNLDLNEKQKHIVKRKFDKLSRLSKMFHSDLIGAVLRVEHKNPPEGFVIKLSFSVPGTKMNAIEKNVRFSMAVGKAFNKVFAQLRSYKNKLKGSKKFGELAKAKGKA